MKPTITAIIPALNEEKNLKGAVDSFRAAVSENFSGYEIILFDDCSSDGTGAIADSLAASDKNIRVIHNEKRMGLGYNYFKGLKLTTKDYVILVFGDNEMEESSVKEIVSKAGLADIIIPYTSNMEIRPGSRQITSRLFTFIVNTLFRVNIKYFNGPALHRTELIRQFKIQETSFAYQAEILVKMIKSGRSFAEVPMMIKPRGYGRSNAISFKNFIGVGKTLLKLFKAVYFTKK